MNGKIDVVKLWIEKADHDLGTAQLPSLYLSKYKDTIAFHCQQAVEKYLKGYLVFLDIAFKKSHSLTYLLSLISQKETISDELYDNAAELEDFSVEIRYPDISIDLTDEDIHDAIVIVKEFREYILNKVKLDIKYSDIVKQ